MYKPKSMKMKKLLLPAIFIAFAFVSKAQFSGERERNIQLLSMQVRNISDSDASMDAKESMLLKLCTEYINNIKDNSLDKELSGVVSQIESNKCDVDKITAYIAKFKAERSGVLSADYIKSVGNVKTDCALSAAVKLYQIIDTEKFGSNEICELLGCDKNTDRRVKSRGEETFWKFTGEKKFVTEAGIIGWRYLCIKVTKDESKQADNTSTSSKASYTPVAGASPEWKKGDLVDIWY